MLNHIYTFWPIGIFWTLSSLLYFGGFDNPKYIASKRNSVTVKQTIQRMLMLNLLQIATTLPLEMGYLNDLSPLPPNDTFRWSYFLGGIFLLDTIEYFVHFAYHWSPWLYKHFHKTHHEMKLSWSYGALYNSYPEALLTGSVIGFMCFSVYGMSMCEFACVTSVGTIFTCLDHCAYFDDRNWFGRKEFHKNHHFYGNGNYQQPFFTFWDILFQTKIYKKSSSR